MSGGIPLGPGLCNPQDIGAVTTLSRGTAITMAVANTLSTYTQLTAATAFDSTWATVTLTSVAGAGNNSFGWAIDIAVGAGGSEKVVAASLEGQYTGVRVYSFPLSIPAGTRIAARGQGSCEGGSTTSYVELTLYDGAISSTGGIAGIDAVGFDAATSKGTLVAVGTAHNKGAYVQLTATTARDYMGVLVGVSTGGALLAQSLLFDVAIGGGGVEIDIMPNQSLAVPIVSAGLAYPPSLVFTPIPASSRVAVRAQSGSSTVVPGFVVYGLYQ